MPKINMVREHGTTLDDAKAKVRTMVDEFVEQERKVISSIDWSQDGTSARAKGTGFTATFTVDDRAVTAKIDLSFLAAPLKGKVERELDKRFTKTFG